jgi:outer membrane protein
MTCAIAQTKVGTVDIERIFKEYSKTKEAEAKIAAAKEAAKKEFDDRVEEYKKALDLINKLNTQIESPAITTDTKAQKAKERDERIANLKKMEREMNEFRQTREQQLQQQVGRMREGILKEISETTLECVKASNADVVFDKSGASLNGFSPLLFTRGSIDLTDEIIASLKKTSERGSPSPRPSP